MSEKLKELRDLSDDELIERHDKEATSTQIGVNHYLSELARRDLDRQTRQMLQYTREMLRYTRWMTIMTIVILLWTILNVALVWKSLNEVTRH